MPKHLETETILFTWYTQNNPCSFYWRSVVNLMRWYVCGVSLHAQLQLLCVWHQWINSLLTFPPTRHKKTFKHKVQYPTKSVVSLSALGVNVAKFIQDSTREAGTPICSNPSSVHISVSSRLSVTCIDFRPGPT